MTQRIHSNLRPLLQVADLCSILRRYPRTEYRIAEGVGDRVAQCWIRKQLCYLGAGVSSSNDQDPLVFELLGIDQIVENAIGCFALDPQLTWSATRADCQDHVARFEPFAGLCCDFKRFASAIYGNDLLTLIDLELHRTQHLFPLFD